MPRKMGTRMQEDAYVNRETDEFRVADILIVPFSSFGHGLPLSTTNFYTLPKMISKSSA